MDIPAWSWLLGGAGALSGALLTVPILLHARHTGRDVQRLDTPRNLTPLGTGPVTRVDDRVRDAVVQFDLPADLRPEEMALLLHDGDPSRAIAAALLDLQAQGIIDRDGLVLTDTPAPAGTSAFQQRLLTILRRRNAAAQWRDWALAALYSGAVTAGWFPERPDYRSYGARLWAAFAFTMAGILGVIGVRMLVSEDQRGVPALAGLALFFAALGLAFRHAQRRRPVRTAQGRALAEQLAGFARVVSVSREGRIVHTGPGAQEWAALEMALGVGTESPRRWAKRIPEGPPA